MADIALMVAEEYEKQLKRGFPVDEGRPSSGAVAKACGNEDRMNSSAVAKLRVALLAKAGMEEPKTGIAMAAFHGVFSA